MKTCATLVYDFSIDNDKEVAIDEIYTKCINEGLSNIAIDRITWFYDFAGDSLIFGRNDIADETVVKNIKTPIYETLHTA